MKNLKITIEGVSGSGAPSMASLLTLFLKKEFGIEAEVVGHNSDMIVGAGLSQQNSHFIIGALAEEGISVEIEIKQLPLQ